MYGTDNNEGGSLDVFVDHATRAAVTTTAEASDIHRGQVFTLNNKMDIATTKVGAIQIRTGDTAATVTVNMTNATSDLTYTAVTKGSAGNNITVTHVDPGAADQELAVSVDGLDITVSLATSGASAITSTAALVKAAVNAHAEASALVTCEDEGAGTGIVNALTAATLAGGTDAVNVRLRARFATTHAPVSLGILEDYTFANGSASTPINRNRTSARTSQITAKTIADATASAGTAGVSLCVPLLPAAGAGEIQEWVLKPATNYLLTMTNSNASTATVGYDLIWAEELV